MKPPGTYLIHRKDHVSLNELRYSTLLDQGSFIASADAVEWSESDERSKVFGIYSEDGVLLSSMRAEHITKPEHLTPKLDYEFLDRLISFPCGLLGKASTRAGFEGRGFNTYLRYLAYEDFHRMGIQYVVGTLMPEASRMKLLKCLGYTFIENPDGWRRYGYNSFGPTLVAYLDLKKNYDRVMSVLETKIRKNRELYPFRESTCESEQVL